MGCIRKTRSVCPVCLEPIPARLVRRGGGTYGDGGVYMEKSCARHGDFSVIVWRDLNTISMESWRGDETELGENENTRCPGGCAGCAEHLQGSCCVLLEVTGKCNLKCAYCFADHIDAEPSTDELKRAIDEIMSGEDKPTLQFSGGEPTMRDDLPELVAYAHEKGCPYTQLNSNGLRLGEDGEYVLSLARAGLSFVFMQFDGVNDGVYELLRGAPLYAEKLRAIEMCDKNNIGVTLVPTIVRGVNDEQIGDIIRLGASLSPAVRGVHFQPVSYFGRYPGQKSPENKDRFTLDELLSCIGKQTDIDITSLRPSRCDHPLCGFHGSFIAENSGILQPLSRAGGSDCCSVTTARRNREYVGQRWKRLPKAESLCCRKQTTDTQSLDDFLDAVRTNGFTISTMAFQDSMNLDIERLRRCSLHVYDKGVMRPFCSRYLTPVIN